MIDNKEQENEWLIGNRSLPVPDGASNLLRKVIENTPAPDVVASLKSVPKSEDEWLAIIAEADNEMMEWVRIIIKESPVSIETGDIEGVTVYRVIPEDIDPRHDQHLFIYIHGGGYMLFGGEAGLGEAIYIARSAKIPVLSIDYRMPPHHPFPAGLEDVLTIYNSLLGHRSAQSIALGGLSAGGGLALAAVHEFIQLGLEVPGAFYVGTPWADLTKTGDSYWINEGIDRILTTYDGDLTEQARIYAGGQDLKNPLLSPIYGDFNGFPPTYLVTGTRDLFLSNTVRVHTKLRAAGVVADLLVFEGMSHADYFFEVDLPESRQTYAELNAFLIKHLK